jgi:hypothetical protein
VAIALMVHLRPKQEHPACQRGSAFQARNPPKRATDTVWRHRSTRAGGPPPNDPWVGYH